MPVENRKHARLNMTKGVNSKTIKGRNVSLGGICIQVENKMKVADVIDVEFHLPGTSNQFTAQAKVKWQEKSDKGYLTGLEFTNIQVVGPDSRAVQCGRPNRARRTGRFGVRATTCGRASADGPQPLRRTLAFTAVRGDLRRLRERVDEGRTVSGCIVPVGDGGVPRATDVGASRGAGVGSRSSARGSSAGWAPRKSPGVTPGRGPATSTTTTRRW